MNDLFAMALAERKELAGHEVEVLPLSKFTLEVVDEIILSASILVPCWSQGPFALDKPVLTIIVNEYLFDTFDVKSRDLFIEVVLDQLIAMRDERVLVKKILPTSLLTKVRLFPRCFIQGFKHARRMKFDPEYPLEFMFKRKAAGSIVTAYV